MEKGLFGPGRKSPGMEDAKSCSTTKLSRSRQPVKTEWGTHYMVLTYFQGDINSMVDEHFSRALRLTKNPQEPSRNQSSENEVASNAENHVPPHQPWGFSPHWAKSYSTSPPLNVCPSHETRDDPVMDFYQPSVLQGSPPTTVAELWPRASSGNPSLAAVSAFPTSQPKAENCMSDDKYSSLLGLLEQENQRCPSSQPDSQSTCPTSSTRLQNLSQRYPF